MLYGEFELKLVKIVEKYPALYDTKSEGYKNKFYKTCLWESIAKDLRAEVEVVIYKWKNIRDYYLKELKKIASLKGNKPIKPRHWQMFETLSFLRSYVGIITRPRDPRLQKCKKRPKKNKEITKKTVSSKDSPVNSNVIMISHSIFSKGIPEMDLGTALPNIPEKDNPSTSSNVSFDVDSDSVLSNNIENGKNEEHISMGSQILIKDEIIEDQASNIEIGKNVIPAEEYISMRNQILIKDEIIIEDQTSIEDLIPTSIIYPNGKTHQKQNFEEIPLKKEITIEDEYLMDSKIATEEDLSTQKKNPSLVEEEQSRMENQSGTENQKLLEDQFLKDDIIPDPEIIFFSELVGAKLAKLSKQSRNTTISGIKNYIISVTETDNLQISY